MEEPPTGAGPETTGNQQEERIAQREAEMREPPRIYVASLSDYNAGRLHGTWIDAGQDAAALHTAVQEMLHASSAYPAEEFAIHDYEGFGPYAVGEYEPLEQIARLAAGIVEHGLAYAAWATTAGLDAIDRFDDAFLGTWPSTEAYAEQLIDDLGWQHALDQALPDGLEPYVTLDIDGFARDLVLGGDITVIEHPDGVWVFDGTV